jgi:hypothetical protein
MNDEKSVRVKHVNQLIRIIGSHGRRFFWNEEKQRFARMELIRGRIYFIDDYSGKPIYTHRTGFGNYWRGFSHGGTLRSLVEDMRDYIANGTQIQRCKIVIKQLGRSDLEDNIWGYPKDDAEAVRREAYALPIISQK